MKDKKSKTLRQRLTVSFIVFACALMGILWLMQSVLFNVYYQYSMRNRIEDSIDAIVTLYTSSESLTISDFCNLVATVSRNQDIQFLVEAADGSFSVSSADQVAGGRFFVNSSNLMREAKDAMINNGTKTLSLSTPQKNGGNTILEARIVDSEIENRPEIYIYAMSMLTPIGPAVAIIRSQLILVTAFALVMGIAIAFFISNRLSRPVRGMSDQAKELAKGNYDINFDGGNNYLELDELADSLNEAAADLKKSDALQRDLMANVSHDLRTPLTMIKSYAEMIRDLSGDIPEKRDQHLGVIIEETDRLSDLVNDVLTISKMQAGVTEMELKDFDIQKAAESVLSTYRVMANEGFVFNFNTLPEPQIVHGDERRLQQVMANLISNAVRYSEEHKEITVSFTRSENVLRCSVADKGVGIAPEDLEQIWQRYKKASSQGQRTQNGGSGLGLSIAAEILNLHNAKYGVDSELGKGSTFWFELPVT